MEPVRHLSAIVSVRVRAALAETEVAASDPLFTSATLRAAAPGSFDDVRHRFDTDTVRGRSVMVPVLSRPHATRHRLIRSVCKHQDESANRSGRHKHQSNLLPGREAIGLRLMTVLVFLAATTRA